MSFILFQKIKIKKLGDLARKSKRIKQALLPGNLAASNPLGEIALPTYVRYADSDSIPINFQTPGKEIPSTSNKLLMTNVHISESLILIQQGFPKLTNLISRIFRAQFTKL